MQSALHGIWARAAGAEEKEEEEEEAALHPCSTARAAQKLRAARPGPGAAAAGQRPRGAGGGAPGRGSAPSHLTPPSSRLRGPRQPRPLIGQPQRHVRRPASAIGPDAPQDPRRHRPSPPAAPVRNRAPGYREGSGKSPASPRPSPTPGQPRPPPPSVASRRSAPAGLTFFTSKRFLPAPLLVPLGVSTSIAAAILDA